MGIFSVNIEVAKPTTRPSFVRVARIMVDTGAEMTWIAQKTLRCIRLDVRKKDQTFIMANGQRVTRNVGYAIIRCGDFETIDEVVFAEVGDLQLLGARTLEGFNAVVDARRKRLVAAGPMPAAASTFVRHTLPVFDGGAERQRVWKHVPVSYPSTAGRTSMRTQGIYRFHPRAPL